MHFIVQPNLFREANYDALVAAIERQGHRLSFVKPVPMTTRLIPADVDAGRGLDVDATPEPIIDVDGPVIAMGTYTLVNVVRGRGWLPGGWVDGLDYESWSTHYPEPWLLNPKARVVAFGEAAFEGDAFVRPSEDTKCFTGQVFSSEEFEAFRKRALAVGAVTLSADTKVLISTPRAIEAEARFFVVNGQLVTWSYYKRGRVTFWSRPGRSNSVFWTDVADETVAFAKRVVETWQPNRAFVVDVAETEEGPCIVEFNCLNAAGYYGCDVARLVDAITTLAIEESK